MTTDNEFASIDVPEKRTSIAGVEVVIRPIVVGQMPAFSRALKPALPALAELLAREGNEGGHPFDLVDLLADHGDALIDAVAIAVNLPRDTIAKVDPLAFLGLAVDVLKMNVDFFVRRLAPALAKAREATAMLGGGPTPSKP